MTEDYHYDDKGGLHINVESDSRSTEVYFPPEDAEKIRQYLIDNPNTSLKELMLQAVKMKQDEAAIYYEPLATGPAYKPKPA